MEPTHTARPYGRGKLGHRAYTFAATADARPRCWARAPPKAHLRRPSIAPEAQHRGLQEMHRRQTAVVVHTFGHFAGGDTILRPYVYQACAAISRVLQGLGEQVPARRKRGSGTAEEKMNRRKILGKWGTWLLGACLAVALVSGGCQTNPYTGRSQLLMMPPSQDMQLGLQAYRQMLTDLRIQKSTDPRETAPVQRVAARVIEAAKGCKGCL
jgi:hypothetical protein